MFGFSCSDGCLWPNNVAEFCYQMVHRVYNVHIINAGGQFNKKKDTRIMIKGINN